MKDRQAEQIARDIRPLNATLISLARNYPHGIPKKLFEKRGAANAEEEISFPYALLIDRESACTTNKSLLVGGGDAGLVLKNLLEKGLGVSSAQVLMFEVHDDTLWYQGAAIADSVAKGFLQKARTILSFGASSQTMLEKILPSHGALLCFPTLHEISKSPIMKREVWQQLKPLVAQ